MTTPKIIVGKIYAEWCGHCQTLAPEWEKMKVELKPHTSVEIHDINNESTDATQRIQSLNDMYLKSSTKKVVANGFPTIFMIKNGEVIDYTGNRTKDAMVSWVTAATPPPAVQPKKIQFQSVPSSSTVQVNRKISRTLTPYIPYSRKNRRNRKNSIKRRKIQTKRKQTKKR
jgi:thiol-disulfide isomerase/thioredoxin